MGLKFTTYKPVCFLFADPGGELARVEMPPVYPLICSGCQGRMIPDKRKTSDAQYRCKPCKITATRISGDKEIIEKPDVPGG